MTATSARRGAGLEAEITQFGERLAAYDFVPEPEHDEALLADNAAALDAYERAKQVMAAARTAAKADLAVRPVLAEGVRALARLDARRQGRPVPPETPSCFFDEGHGPSVTEVPWTPPGGTARRVPVCAADTARLRGAAAVTVVKERPQVTAEKKRVVRLDSPGPEQFRLDRDPTVPAVLVLRAVSYGKRLSTTLQRLGPGTGSVRPLGQLLKAGGDFTARLPVPVAGGSDGSAWFRISNGAVTGAPFDPLDFDVDRIPHWEAWLESVDSCREFTTSIGGDGWDVVRYPGGRATAWLTRDSRRGEVVVTRLNPEFHAAEQLFRSNRSVVDGRLALPAKPTWLAVHCQGPWTLTVNPGRPGRRSAQIPPPGAA